MRDLTSVIVFTIVALMLLDLIEWMGSTERRLRALERDGIVIKGPWKDAKDGQV